MTAPAYLYAATVERVVDADTIAVAIDLGFRVQYRTHVRVADVDAPELHTPEGRAARVFVVDLLEVHGLHVLLRTYKPDKYGRALADVTLDPDGTPHDLATALLDAGHARRYIGGAR